MATVNRPDLETTIPDERHDQELWEQLFDRQVRHELIEDDLLASRSVCGVLIAIVVGGLLLGILAVLLTI